MQAGYSSGDRVDYIDFLKGVACIVMLMSHAMRLQIGNPDLVAKYILMSQPPAAQVFFFVSGMNIILVLERYRNRPNFNLTAYYIWGAVLLFFMGYLYNLARMSLGTWQIFQGIAASTAVAFLLLKTRLSNLSLVLLSILFYLIYFQFRLTVEPVLAWYRYSLPVGAPPQHPESLLAVRTLLTGIKPVPKMLFTNFGLLPWLSYVLLGGAAFRSVRANPARARAWGIGFAITFVLGLAAIYLPLGIEWGLWFVDDTTDVFFRHVPYHALTATGAAGLLWLACHRWYRGAAAIRNPWRRGVAGYLEYLGRFSFAFFCYHWIGLIALTTGWSWMAEQGWVPVTMNIHLRWILTFVIVLPLLMPVAWMNIHWSRRPHSLGEQLLFIVLTLIGWFTLHQIGEHHFATIVIFFGCTAMAFAYPTWRGRLKVMYTRRLPAPAQ